MNRLVRDGIVLSASVSCFNLYNIESQMKEVEEAGIKHIAGPGAPIRIHPGSSITIPPYLYHMFYADKTQARFFAAKCRRSTTIITIISITSKSR